jgi:hypothetical protein
LRLQSHIWVSAFLRHESRDSAFATVIRKGSPEAGAIFLVHTHRDGSCSVYAPAPQALVWEELPGDRHFELVHVRISQQAAQEWLDRQVAFDPDCWIVETERGDGTPGLL